jgi:hypothetical protein
MNKTQEEQMLEASSEEKLSICELAEEYDRSCEHISSLCGF